MTKQNEKLPTLDDVLNEFVVEYEQPTAEALKTWIGRYPQFRSELIEFAAAWAEEIILPSAPEMTTEEEERLVDRAMSHALNVSFSRDEQARAQESSKSESGIKSLTGEARSAGLNVSEFAKACGLDLALVTKLNNRQIIPNTIPSRLISEIARLLEKTIEAIKEYLGRPPNALAGTSFLARGKPQGAEQQSFADAVRASSLSDAEKARWLDEAPGREGL